MAYVFTIILVIFELLIAMILSRMRNVGIRRSAGITGWAALFIGLSMIINSGKIGYSEMAFYLLSFIGAFAIVAVLIIFLPIGRPDFYRGFFRRLLTGIPKIGWAIAVIMPLILAILGV